MVGGGGETWFSVSNEVSVCLKYTKLEQSNVPDSDPAFVDKQTVSSVFGVYWHPVDVSLRLPASAARTAAYASQLSVPLKSPELAALWVVNRQT